MKRLISLLALLAFIGTASSQTTVLLAWDYSPSVITNYTHDPLTGTVTGFTLITNYPDTFVLRSTKQANASLDQWPIFITFAAMQTNMVTGAFAVVTNITVPAVPQGAQFFVLTASNAGGESPFSNTALRKPGADPAANLSAVKAP